MGQNHAVSDPTITEGQKSFKWKNCQSNEISDLLSWSQGSFPDKKTMGSKLVNDAWGYLFLVFRITLSNIKILIAKFRLILKKVGKTTRPFRYDLNKTPYNNAVDVTNRLKELDLIDRVPEELWVEIPGTV